MDFEPTKLKNVNVTGELIKMARAWDIGKSESPTGIKPMTSLFALFFLEILSRMTEKVFKFVKSKKKKGQSTVPCLFPNVSFVMYDL